MKRLTCLLSIWALFTPIVRGLEVASIFTDHMVLQQEMPVPVWGTGTPGEDVSISFSDQKKSITVDAKGQWSVQLEPLKASTNPESIVVHAKSGDKTIADVLVGEVWIASGQSNMALTLGQANGTPEMKAGDPMIRMFSVERRPSATPQKSAKGSWQISETGKNGHFSAVGYYFAKHLLEARKVPIGIIHSSWGGTPARAWTPREAMAGSPQLKHNIDTLDEAVSKFDAAKVEADYQASMAKYQEQLAAFKTRPDQKDGQKMPKAPAKPSSPALNSNNPCSLYNGMIAPLVPVAIRGVIWYQGESDRTAPDEYRVLFPTMIQSWRQAFGHEFPFLYVQVAPFENMTPEIRDAQLYAWRTVPKTAMAVITDYGDAKDIHPKDKEPVGARLALAARALAHGEKIEYSGPLFDQIKLDGSKVVLAFKHIGDGLAIHGDKLTGMEISGNGIDFVPATAVINSDTVVVSSNEVPEPVAVRFGWANVPTTNLFNKNGLPATPFKASVK